MNHTYIYLAGTLLIVGLAVCPLIIPRGAISRHAWFNRRSKIKDHA